MGAGAVGSGSRPNSVCRPHRAVAPLRPESWTGAGACGRAGDSFPQGLTAEDSPQLRPSSGPPWV